MIPEDGTTQCPDCGQERRAERAERELEQVRELMSKTIRRFEAAATRAERAEARVKELESLRLDGVGSGLGKAFRRGKQDALDHKDYHNPYRQWGLSRGYRTGFDSVAALEPPGGDKEE